MQAYDGDGAIRVYLAGSTIEGSWLLKHKISYLSRPPANKIDNKAGFLLYLTSGGHYICSETPIGGSGGEGRLVLARS